MVDTHEWKEGDIARYSDGTSAFFRLDHHTNGRWYGPHCLTGTHGSRWYGQHCLTGTHGATEEYMRQMTADDWAQLRLIKPKWCPDAIFEVGDAVRKYKGDYQLNGTIVAIYRVFIKSGQTRVVVRHGADVGYFQHIYSPDQLRHD